uniref:Hypothetical chloroplast RF37 n=1 Tax=Gastroclonium compressum TaxID=1852973 RepID=A0A173FZU6_GASCM|nr:hypothetical chloroplast RF37 [Coeloseira compressa]ANH09549.1 hypothetical chloroplast RF37 [Coeloseira compressa]
MFKLINKKIHYELNTKIIYENHMICTYFLNLNLYDVWIFDIYLLFIIFFLGLVSYLIVIELIKYITYFIIDKKNNVFIQCKKYAFTKQWLSYIMALEFSRINKIELSKNSINHIYSKIGLCFDQLTHYQAAIKYYSKYLQDDPSNIYILEKLASIYKKQKNNEQALSIYKKLIAIDPKNKEAVKYLD